MPETTYTKIKRSSFASFLNTGTKEAKVWSRFGKGVTEQTVSYNPQVTTEQYINEDNSTSFVDGYQVNIATPQTCYVEEPVFKYVDEIRRRRAIGKEAETEVLLVYLYNKNADGSYAAELNDVAIQIDDFGGPANEPTKINYTLNFSGDPVLGTVSITEGVVTFTAETASNTTGTASN